jgi:hypothetical protein
MTDPSEFFHQVENIFQKVMETPASLRSAMLETACHGDAKLFEEVQSLIQACEQEELATASLQSEADKGLEGQSS